MPTVGMDLGLTWKIGDNFVKCNVEIRGIDVDGDVPYQVKKSREGIVYIHEALIDELDEKILKQIDVGEGLPKRVNVVKELISRVESLEKKIGQTR